MVIKHYTTGKQHLMRFGFLAVLALGVIGLTHSCDKGQERKREKRIVKAIINNNLDLAKSYRVKYGEKGLLDEEEAIVLDAKIDAAEKAQEKEKEKANFNYQFEQLLKTDISSAKDLFEKVVANDGATSIKRKMYLKAKLDSLSEESIVERLKSRSIKDRLRDAEDYLALYPEREHRDVVLRGLISDKFISYLNSISDTTSFYVVSKNLHNLCNLLEEHADSSLYMANLVDIADVLEKTKKFEEKNSYLAKVPSFQEGFEVSIRGFISSDYASFSRYLKERNSGITIGQEGVVVGVDKTNIYVAFEEESEKWNTNFENVSTYWDKTGKKNVALFMKEELFLIQKIHDIEKNKLKEESNRLKEAFIPYSTEQ